MNNVTHFVYFRQELFFEILFFNIACSSLFLKQMVVSLIWGTKYNVPHSSDKSQHQTYKLLNKQKRKVSPPLYYTSHFKCLSISCFNPIANFTPFPFKRGPTRRFLYNRTKHQFTKYKRKILSHKSQLRMMNQFMNTPRFFPASDHPQ